MPSKPDLIDVTVAMTVAVNSLLDAAGYEPYCCLCGRHAELFMAQSAPVSARGERACLGALTVLVCLACALEPEGLTRATEKFVERLATQLLKNGGLPLVSEEL